MKPKQGWRVRVVVWALAVVGSAATAAWAQNYLAQAPMAPMPELPPDGAWAEVIFSNAKWLVVQNRGKQQFPIAIDNAHVQQFLVRWPSSPDLLTNESMIEAVGRDAGSNTMMTDHIDVYEGSDQLLVRPTLRGVLPDARLRTVVDPTYPRMVSPFDPLSQAMFSGWTVPINPAQLSIPARLHAVGTVMNLDPLRVATPGNNSATILPGASNNISMTQVTLGSASFIENGDLVFLVPQSASPKSLVLSQLVLYKKMPRHRFNP